MLKLFKVNDDSFIILIKDASYECTLIQAVTRMACLGIEFHEIELAMSELNDKGHHKAEFGIFGHFICTSKVA